MAGGSTDSAAMLARNVMHGYQSEVLPLRLPFTTDNIRIHPKSTITIVNDLKQVYWGVQTNSRVVSRRIIRSLRVFFDNYSTLTELLLKTKPWQSRLSLRVKKFQNISRGSWRQSNDVDHIRMSPNSSSCSSLFLSKKCFVIFRKAASDMKNKKANEN